MKLIDADTLAKVKFHGYPDIEITPFDVDVEAYKRGWNDAIDAIIESTPSIDAVPVVRCNDCKHYKQSDVVDRKMCCRKDVDGMPVCYDFLPDDWCKYGERKEDE